MSFTSATMAHAAFVPTGILTVMLGPLLPLVAGKWSLNDSQAGNLISAQFLGSLLGTVSSSFLLPRLGFRASMAVGQGFMALGAGTLLSGGAAFGAASVCCYGIGIGLTIPAGNLAVAQTYAEKRSSSLNLLNFCWSAGAVTCPFLLASLKEMHRINLFLRGVAGLLVALCVVLLLSPGDPEFLTARATRTIRPTLRNLQSSAAVVLAILFFVYVGTESALGAWLASYTKRVNDSHGVVWMLVSSFFYGALLLGRALAPLAARRLGDIEQACAGALLTSTSSAILLLSHSTPTIAVCAFLAGLGLSTLYPITISLLACTFGEEASGMAGFMFALSTLGGASFPWVVGHVSTTLGSLRVALLIPLAGSLLMLALFARSRWKAAGIKAAAI